MKQEREFLRKSALLSAIGAAFQHAPIYLAPANENKRAKEQLKHDLEQYLRFIENQYRRRVSSHRHCRNINELAHQLSQGHSRVLKHGRFRVGIAQKAVNTYLKFLWCYGWIPEPPHCPLDSIVLKKAGEISTKYTQLDHIADYHKVIKRISKRIGGKSLSRWELEVYNKR